MNQSLKKQAAFTLVELMVSMGLLGTFLVMINQYFISSNTITSSIAVQTTSQEELRTAGAIINDTVQRAIYVFLPAARTPVCRQVELLSCQIQLFLPPRHVVR